MKEYKDEAWALIPARGGSKSIPLKNMAPLNGRPLIDYVIKAAKAGKLVSRIFCSTDNAKISSFCLSKGIEVQNRPNELAGDNVSTTDVLIYFLTKMMEHGRIADIIVLLESTSPFILPKHIEESIRLLRDNPEADSVQTITSIVPNCHAYNQRFLKDGFVYFRFPEERVNRFNKQLKPEFFIHGNLRVIRTLSFLRNKDIYGKRSLPYIIPRIYAMDVDGPEDLKLAQCLIKCRALKAPKKVGIL